MGSPRALVAVAVLAVCGAAFFLLRGRGDGTTDGAGRGQGSGPRGPLAVADAPPSLAAGPRVPKDATAASPATPTSAVAGGAEAEPLDPADRPAWWPASAMDEHRAVRLRVHCVNAATGESVAARWRLMDAMWVSVPSVPWLDSRWRGGDLAATVFPEPDASIGRWLEIATPEGYLPPTEGRIQQPIAFDAEQVTITVPLWPTFKLELTLRGPDGAPAEGARLLDLRVQGGVASETSVVPELSGEVADASGRIRVKGLAFVPGAEVHARVAWPSASPHRTVRPPAEAPTEDLEEVEVRRPSALLRLPLEPVDFLSAEVRVEGPTDEDGLPGRHDRSAPVVEDLVEEEDLGEPVATADPATVGRLRVRVRGADGRLVERARVTCDALHAVTAADGTAELSNVAAGDREVWASVSGGFRWSTRVQMDAGTRVDVELREPAAGRLDIEVVDGEGRPCPSAHVHVYGAGGSVTYDVEDGVQRLDDLTDASGKRSYRRVAPGDTSAFAEWRGRRGEAKVVVEERGRVSARVVVR
ncbi:MAG: hypothetical protein JNM10_03485 [Planctomycetia bacterium]|nr:hypothetical protein [Planctomycetia bacterium]